VTGDTQTRAHGKLIDDEIRVDHSLTTGQWSVARCPRIHQHPSRPVTSHSYKTRRASNARKRVSAQASALTVAETIRHVAARTLVRQKPDVAIHAKTS